jgi:hypothetical protein
MNDGEYAAAEKAHRESRECHMVIPGGRQVLLLAQQTGAYAEMVINSSFLYYLNFPASDRSRDGDAVAATCLMGAVRTIELLQALKDCVSLNNAH